MARVVVHVDAVTSGELDEVPRDKLKVALRRLETDPTVGKPLVRELKGCRSIRVGGSENRLVYRINGDVVEVLAVGRRREGEIHTTAQARL